MSVLSKLQECCLEGDLVWGNQAFRKAIENFPPFCTSDFSVLPRAHGVAFF